MIWKDFCWSQYIVDIWTSKPFCLNSGFSIYQEYVDDKEPADQQNMERE